MHTTTIEADGVTYHVHHNSDWSGEAYIIWRDAAGEQRRIELPGAVLAACGRRDALRAAIAAMESLY